MSLFASARKQENPVGFRLPTKDGYQSSNKKCKLVFQMNVAVQNLY